MIGDTLLAAKAALETSTLFAKWKRDNPKESARVEAYWVRWDGADLPLPATATAFGAHYALDAQAYHEETAPLPFLPI